MCLTFSLIDNTFMSKWEIQFILTNGPQVRGILPPILLGNSIWAAALATSLKRASLLTSAKVMFIKVRQLPGLPLTITLIAFLDTCLVQKMSENNSNVSTTIYENLSRCTHQQKKKIHPFKSIWDAGLHLLQLFNKNNGISNKNQVLHNLDLSSNLKEDLENQQIFPFKNK